MGVDHAASRQPTRVVFDCISLRVQAEMVAGARALFADQAHLRDDDREVI